MMMSIWWLLNCFCLQNFLDTMTPIPPKQGLWPLFSHCWTSILCWLDPLLTFLALGDVIDRDPAVVDVEAIASTVFVLPCVKNPDDPFPVDIDKATYFLVMARRADWKNSGWDDGNGL